MQTDDTVVKHEALIGSNRVKFLFPRGRKNYLLYDLLKVGALQRRNGKSGSCRALFI